jgi:citronellol/citronellal dehydrogenase
VCIVQRTVDEFGRVGILINNAGATRLGPLSGLTTKAWDASFDLNARSAYFCTREAGRHLTAQRSGAIVNVSSGAGINGVRGGTHYASSKAALQMFTKVTAAEWGAMAFGLIASPLGWLRRSAPSRHGASRNSTLAPWLQVFRWGGRAHLTRSRMPSTFLAGDAASYISGQTFAVDGCLAWAASPIPDRGLTTQLFVVGKNQEAPLEGQEEER